MVIAVLERMVRELHLSSGSPHPVIARALVRLGTSTYGNQRTLCRQIAHRIAMVPAISHLPEVAFCLHVLNRSEHCPTIAAGYWKLLEFHTGLTDLDDIGCAPVLLVRQFHIGYRWYRRDSTDMPFLPGPVGKSSCSRECAIGAVTSEQFSDMALESAWDTIPGPALADISAIEAAYDLLSEKLAPAANKLFGTIVQFLLVSTEISNGKRHSFNLRLAYPGTIFLDPAGRPALLVAEDIFHEWIHQLLWLSWELKYRPFSEAEWHCSLVSPMTGNRRALPVMSQALVIYHAAAHFLRLHRNGDAWCQLAAERLAHLEHKLPLLLNLIKSTGSPHPAVRESIAIVENSDVECY